MKPEQDKKLANIEDKLLEVFLEESDPDQWEQVDPAAERKEQQQTRGDRYWQAKTANQTISLLTKIIVYRQRLKEQRGAVEPKTGGDDDSKMSKDIKAAEAKVKARLSLVKKRAC